MWLVKNEKELRAQVLKSVKSAAIPSDQAKTPIWLLDRIKKFSHLSDQEILDIFVY
jgi:hypothetical protein